MNRQISFKSIWIVKQQSVHQTKQLHYAFVLAKILVAFEQEHVIFAIATYDCQKYYLAQAVKTVKTSYL